MKRTLYCFFAALLALCTVACDDEDKPTGIPTAPAKFSLEDGAVLTTTEVKLDASGGIVDSYEKIYYKLYFGKSPDELREVYSETTLSLEPYTQYFWKAKSFTLEKEGEESEIRTFYCVPPLTIETDNGDGDWAAVVRFKEVGQAVVSGKVTAVSDILTYEMDVEAGQDSCFMKYDRYADGGIGNNAYTQWWDDSKGKSYEPIVYDFKVELNVQVGDKVFPLTSQARECVLNKQACVRDHEFNVYKLVRIGNRTWFAEDLRAKSFIYKGDTILLENTRNRSNAASNKDICKTVTLPESGSVGVCYAIYYQSKSSIYFNNSKNKEVEMKVWQLFDLMAPKGFRVSNGDDWDDLEMFYGIENPTCDRHMGRYLSDFINPGNFETTLKNYMDFQGEDVLIRRILSSKYDWIRYFEDEEPNSESGPFNSKPFAGEGYASFYYTSMNYDGDPSMGMLRLLSSLSMGIMNSRFDVSYPSGPQYVSLRCVKEE